MRPDRPTDNSSGARPGSVPVPGIRRPAARRTRRPVAAARAAQRRCLMGTGRHHQARTGESFSAKAWQVGLSKDSRHGPAVPGSRSSVNLRGVLIGVVGAAVGAGGDAVPQDATRAVSSRSALIQLYAPLDHFSLARIPIKAGYVRPRRAVKGGP